MIDLGGTIYVQSARTGIAYASKSARTPATVVVAKGDWRTVKGTNVKDDVQRTSNAAVDATNHSDRERAYRLLEAFFRERHEDSREAAWSEVA